MAFEVEGRLISFNGLIAKAKIWPVSYMDVVEDASDPERRYVVTGFDRNYANLTPLFDNQAVSSSGRIVNKFQTLHFNLNPNKVLHGPLGDCEGNIKIDLTNLENNFDGKIAISEMFRTGIKGIDWFMPLGVGQRSVVIANAGVGKSTLIKYLLLHSSYDVAVIGLIGERGREVGELQDFVNENCLSKDIKIVVSTSSESSIRRFFSFISATQLASFYRSLGKNVLLVVDSLTRVARAIREIGLQNGEIPARQGLTPSVFTLLPKYLEVPGRTANGSITAIYTLLISDNHEQDPLAEEIKSLLDGHIILSRGVQQKGVYPAIDLVSSLSRLHGKFLSNDELRLIDEVKRNLKILEQDRELMYLANSVPPHLSKALAVEEVVYKWIKQSQEQSWTDNERNEFLRELNLVIAPQNIPRSSKKILNDARFGSVP